MSEPTNIQRAGRHLIKAAIFFQLSFFCAVIIIIVAVFPFTFSKLSETYLPLLFYVSLGCVTILCMIKALANLHMAGENLTRKW